MVWFALWPGATTLQVSCTHCQSHYTLAEAMLGKKARCKSCGKVFTIIPSSATRPIDSDEVYVPRSNGSTARLRPVSTHEVTEFDDPMDALADAAFDSGSQHQPTRRPIPDRTNAHTEASPRTSRRMANGAAASMGIGITALGLAVVGGVLCIFATLNGKDDDLVAMLGGISVGLSILAAILSMIAIFNATSATRNIRKARHPIGGRAQAKAGTITSLITLLLVLITLVGGGIWIWKRGGIVFHQTVGPDGKPITSPAKTSPPAAPPATP